MITAYYRSARPRLICCASVKTMSLLPVEAMNMSHTATSITTPSEPGRSLMQKTSTIFLCSFILRCWNRRGAGRGGGCTRVMHSRSLKTSDPSIPIMPGRSTSGFHRRGRHHVHQARSAVRCSGSHVKGELQPSKNHL